MLENEADQRWTSKTLNVSLNAVLRDNFELCRNIIEETKDVIEGIKEELKRFDVLAERQEKGESIRSVTKRLRGAIKIVFDKRKYEKCIGDLRDRNGDLSALRSQISAMQQDKTCTTGICVRRKELPTRFESIQDASQKLHEALCGIWCCDDTSHLGHYAKLCVDAEVQKEVRLDLAIFCHDQALAGKSCVLREPPIWLYVQSISMAAKDCVSMASNAIVDLKASLPIELSTIPSSNALKKRISCNDTESRFCRKKPMRVHFTDTAVANDSKEILVQTLAIPTTIEFNLRQTKNICHYLKRNYQACDGSLSKHCVGYLETPQMYKHMFYLQEKRLAVAAKTKHVENTTTYSLFEVMKYDVDDVIEIQDQLRLAHKTAVATLQFNNTSWLSERWRLQDLSYFGDKNVFDEAALKTLHLSSHMSSRGQPIEQAMDGVECAANIVSDEVRYGVYNSILFFLGVALLEIAHWKPLEENMTHRDHNEQLFAARRLASGRAPLGPEY